MNGRQIKIHINSERLRTVATNDRVHPVTLTVLCGRKVQGVIFCNQPRILDIAARGGRFCEKAPDYIVDEVIAKLQTLLD
jgi:mRNA-degrading endonuclease toxin of MazEF toxin-antitoxin module